MPEYLKTVCISWGLAALCAMAEPSKANAEYPDFYSGDTTKGIDFVQSVKVLAPAYGSNVQGDVTVVFTAPGMRRAVARCWQQPTPEHPGSFGHDSVLADLELDAETGRGLFVFHADDFPNGPVTVRIQTRDGGSRQDYCELQLYNLGGKPWKQGIPPQDPPGAKGMRLVFSDDFDGPLSISKDGAGACYAAHKTGGGDFSGWPFSDPLGENEPFGQFGTYLRIHASKPVATGGRTGILSSLRADGTGVCVPVPSYFECRFLCHSAPGSWGAFWTLTKGTIGMDRRDPGYDELRAAGCDELDVIECYGGYGSRNPNHGGGYGITTHFWGQDKTRPSWSVEKLADGSANPDYRPNHFWPDTLKLGGKSSWSWTFHTYGLAITERDTVYYFDDIEVGRHPTGPVSLSQPAWFLINYAIGGISGWPIDMARYENSSDMWVDYVRVYCGCALPPEVTVNGFAGTVPALVTCSNATSGAVICYTLDGSDPTKESARYKAPVPVSKPAVFKAAAFAEGLKASPVVKVPVKTAPGVKGSIGVNFMSSDDVSQRFAPTEVAGIGETAQGFWNNLPPGEKGLPKLLDNDGGETAVSLSVEGEAKPERGEDWGFNGSDSKLKRGNLASNPQLVFRGIPYPSYDVVVHLGAGIHNVQGDISAKAGGTIQGYAFNYAWNGGKHVAAAKSAGAEEPDANNYAVFRRLSGSELEVVMKWRGGKGWTGIAAVQIIPCD
ncbi:MAG: chitobiase/beta-hexosaminidase C-terminal domain-containing protein [Kiritimatiellae bacterium]|nr:chitobiase/beta-hexosaminidase C-terminal domain-containing protein [Kiritimatiellia bacterium]